MLAVGLSLHASPISVPEGAEAIPGHCVVPELHRAEYSGPAADKTWCVRMADRWLAKATRHEVPRDAAALEQLRAERDRWQLWCDGHGVADLHLPAELP